MVREGPFDGAKLVRSSNFWTPTAAPDFSSEWPSLWLTASRSQTTYRRDCDYELLHSAIISCAARKCDILRGHRSLPREELGQCAMPPTGGIQPVPHGRLWVIRLLHSLDILTARRFPAMLSTQYYRDEFSSPASCFAATIDSSRCRPRTMQLLRPPGTSTSDHLDCGAARLSFARG
jgi:hypothetical protein